MDDDATAIIHIVCGFNGEIALHIEFLLVYVMWCGIHENAKKSTWACIGAHNFIGINAIFIAFKYLWSKNKRKIQVILITCDFLSSLTSSIVIPMAWRCTDDYIRWQIIAQILVCVTTWKEKCKKSDMKHWLVIYLLNFCGFKLVLIRFRIEFSTNLH